MQRSRTPARKTILLVVYAKIRYPNTSGEYVKIFLMEFAIPSLDAGGKIEAIRSMSSVKQYGKEILF